MKHILLLITVAAFTLQSKAQLPDLSDLGIPLDSISVLDGILTQDPNGERYRDPVFGSVLYATGIPYGVAPVIVDSVRLPGQTYPLAMDVYQPAVDLSSEPRPVIVFAFGGSFVYGARVSPDIVQLCTRFAQLGYVTVSIDYRLSDELLIRPTYQNAFRAVGKAMHDMRAAVRFLRMQEANLANILNIDTERIYVGGVSAGAFAALHTAYLDRVDELPLEFQPIIEDIGGIEGESGNPEFSSAVAGCINLCGALGEKEWMEPGDVPLVSMHGDEDGTVPYDSDTIRALDINYPVDGSAAIHRHANRIGVHNDFYTYVGAGHTPFVLPGLVGPSEMAYMDTTFWFIRDFMFPLVTGETSSVLNSPNAAERISLFPNPTPGSFHLPTQLQGKAVSVSAYGMDGKMVWQEERLYQGTALHLDAPPGVYTMVVETQNTQYMSKLLVE